MSGIQEIYHAQAVAADSTTQLTGQGVGGFIAVTAGTITITGSLGTVLLNAFPVAIGGVYKFGIYTGVNPCTVTLAGGASGTILKL